MGQNISLWGATYTGAEGLKVPKSGSGIALFCDPSGVTATAADVAAGKLFLTAAGVLTQGTASGGGGGLVFETGEYKPTTDTMRATISFKDTHTDVPILVGMADVSGRTGTQNNDALFFMWFDYYRLFGIGIPYNSSNMRYGSGFTIHRTSSGIGTSGNHVSFGYDDTGDSANSYARYWVTEKEFKPTTSSNSRVWRVGRTYKWIAVWAPTT